MLSRRFGWATKIRGTTLHILHLALGGCLKAPPVGYGLTADTGGHIAYVLEAAGAQAARDDVARVTIVTRLFDDPALGEVHARACEEVAPKLLIERVGTADRRYLEKEALAAELPAFTAAFLDWLGARDRLPDVIHAHFADAAQVAAAARARFGVPFVYTPHALGIDKRAAGSSDPALDARVAQEREAIEQADAVLVSSRDEAERQVGAYGVPARVRCAAPGVPHRAAPAGPTLADRLSEWLDDPAKPILLAVARPVGKKNVAALLRAMILSPALRARANVVVLAGQSAGRASLEEEAVLAELRALAARPELRGRAALPEAHNANDVAALYALAARGGVFVNPALHEPFGLTILEAAAAGVPVVATGRGGPAEVVPAIGHGLLVDPRDDRVIADACLAIVSDAALHRRLAAAALAGAARYSWDAYAARSVALYGELAAPAMLACDIDNTLTGCAEGARAFAAWAATRGVPFVVATGRSLDAAAAVLARWGLPEPDAWVTDVGTCVTLADGHGGWAACATFAQALDRGWDRGAAERALAPLGLRRQGSDGQGPHKLSFLGTAGQADAARAALAAAGAAARVVHSHGEFIDVLAPAGGKAAALAHLAGAFGLTLARVVAAGDSGNDRDMLDACGRAIVVGRDPDLDDILPRPGLYRASGAHANGVLEGLERLGLAAPARAAA